MKDWYRLYREMFHLSRARALLAALRAGRGMEMREEGIPC